MSFCYRIIFIFFFLSIASSIEVIGQQNDSIAYDVALEDVLITAQYKPTALKNVLYNVDVIHDKTISERGITQLDQALLLSPLVRIDQDVILGSKIKFKGIDSRNVAILIDGIPIIGRLDGAIDLSQIALQNIQRIEILQGPLSNIYGNNAAGGVINLITKKAQPNVVSAAIEGLKESVGIQNLQSSIGLQNNKFRFGLHGRIFEYNRFSEDSLRLIQKITQSDGSILNTTKYPWNPKTQKSFGSSLLYRINDVNQVSVKYDFNNEVVTDYDQIRRPTFKPYSNDNFYTTQRNDIAVFYNGNVHKKNYIDFAFGRNNYRRVTETKRFVHETRSFDSTLYLSDTINFLSYYSRLNFARPIGDKMEIMSGITFSNDKAQGDRIINRDNVDSSSASFTEYAIYAELKYNVLKDLHLMASGRQTVHSIYKNKFTPTFQLKYDALKNFSIRASYSQGYRSPDLKELYIEFIDLNHFIIGNTSLSPEISTDKQLTLTYANKRYKLNLGTYHTEIKDKITLVLIEEPLKYQYVNFEQYKVYGFQAGFDVSLMGINVSSASNLGYWSTGINLEAAPAYGEVFDMNNSVNFTIPKVKINLSANHRYTGKQPNYGLVGEEIYISEIEAANFIDASLNRSFIKNKISITTGVKNITNVQNLNVSGTISGTHQPSGSRLASLGRSYFVSLKINL